jgi:hypothetical protein
VGRWRAFLSGLDARRIARCCPPLDRRDRAEAPRHRTSIRDSPVALHGQMVLRGRVSARPPPRSGRRAVAPQAPVPVAAAMALASTPDGLRQLLDATGRRAPSGLGGRGRRGHHGAVATTRAHFTSGGDCVQVRPPLIGLTVPRDDAETLGMREPPRRRAERARGEGGRGAGHRAFCSGQRPSRSSTRTPSPAPPLGARDRPPPARPLALMVVGRCSTIQPSGGAAQSWSQAATRARSLTEPCSTGSPRPSCNRQSPSMVSSVQI